jgi:thiamine biosynthesis protein ThiS
MPHWCRDRDLSSPVMNSNLVTVIANGKQVQAKAPCSLEQFLVAQNLLPRSVVVELNGDAVAPSEFAQRQVREGDRMEIVKIVAGG